MSALVSATTAAASATAALPDPTLPSRSITSAILGDVDVPQHALYTFADGMHGFPTHVEFALLPAAREGFWWLQSASEAHLAFLLVDPFRVVPGYEVDLGQGDVRALDLTSPEHTLVLTVVTLPGGNEGQPTTNLRGPVVLNTSNQRGRQVVSAVEGHSFQEPVKIA